MSDVRFELKAVGSVIADRKGFALQIDDCADTAALYVHLVAHLSLATVCRRDHGNRVE